MAQMLRGVALSGPDDALGVRCDTMGPCLGSIRLLEKTTAGFWPRPIADLDAILSAAFGEAISTESLRPGLEAVARALDAKDMTRAIFATQFLQLPRLTGEQARRAIAAEALRKAAVDDKDHPGWPAGTPDGKGGKYRPKDGEDQNNAVILAQVARKKSIEKTQQRLTRRIVRTFLKNLLNWKRVLRIGGEIASNVVPGADIIGDAALVADIIEAASEYEELASDANAVIEFINKGPYSLEELQATSSYEEFSNFDHFKKINLDKVFGAAGNGMEWHHIVEQGLKDNAVSIENLQSTTNIIRLPKAIHELVTSEYASLIEDGGETLRGSLRGQPFEERRAAGIKVLRTLGILKD